MLPAALLAALISAPPSGQIAGEVHYPGCAAPADLEVCAEREDGTRACTRVDRKGRYRLSVPAGAYQVYAEAPLTLPGKRAYFSAAVQCGQTVDCADHTPVEVAVKAKAKVVADPADWAGAFGLGRVGGTGGMLAVADTRHRGDL